MSELLKFEVLACDLDGCIANWVDGFVGWCRSNSIIVRSGTVDLPEFSPLKEEFHSTGGFRSLAQIDHAVDTLREWRFGEPMRRLVFITARPSYLPGVVDDTLDWLSKIGLHGNVYFDENKGKVIDDLIVQERVEVSAFIEDKGEHAIDVAARGHRVLKLPYNGRHENIDHDNVHEIDCWMGIRRIILGDV